MTSKSPKKSTRDSFNSSVRSLTNANKLSSFGNVHKSEMEKILSGHKTASPRRLNQSQSQSYSNSNTNFTRSNGFNKNTVDY